MMKKNSVMCLALSLWGIGSVYAESSQRPNIVLINIDDLGWTDLSGNGSDYYETPCIDRLKNKGIWFARAYAGGANSAPSRACMLTGKNTPRHGMYTVNGSDRGDRKRRKLVSVRNRIELPDSIRLLPRILKDMGYQTFHVGKWHVTEDPCKAGMDINIGGGRMGNPATYFSPYRNRYLTDGEKGEFLTDRLGDEAVRLIEQADGKKPYFLYYAPYAVHTPLEAPEEIVEKYRKKKPTEAHRNPVYAALIEVMDRNVGKVLKAIEESGAAGNTIVVFTSDNGGVYDISKQWPLRAGKGAFYEGGIRVPLIVYQPGKMEHRRIEDVVVSQLDLFPTVADWIGYSDPLVLDGKSLLPLLEEKKEGYLKERALFWHFPAYLEGGNVETVDLFFRTRPVSVVLKGDWKLIENYEDGRLELYNLKRDVGERNELSAAFPEKMKELKGLLDQWKKEVNAPCCFQRNEFYVE